MAISIRKFFTSFPLRLIRRALGLVKRPSPKDQPPVEPAIPALTAHPLEQQTAIERPARFTEHAFQFADALYAYRLYRPGDAQDGTLPAAPLPLLELV